MFLPFKNREAKKIQNQNHFGDRVAIRIVHKCIRMQLRWARYMGRKTEGLSLRWLKVYCIAFCLVSISCSLYLVVKSLHGGDKKGLKVTAIKAPAHATRTSEKVPRFFTITKTEMARIERFKRFMDSLGGSETGRQIRAHLISSRPGLMDSIRFLEKLYQLQTSKN